MKRRRSSEAVGIDCVESDMVINREENDKMMMMNTTSQQQNVSPSDVDAIRSLRQRYRRFYFLHSALVLCILTLGMIHNGGNRKYIPVQTKELFNIIPTSKECTKAYVNVHSFTVEEEFAAICCSDSADDGAIGSSSAYESDLCNPRILGISTQQLPFAKRLTQLTEAWILPLLPIIFRLIYQLVMLVYSYASFTNTSMFSLSKHQNGEEATLIQREATSFSTSQASSSSLSAAEKQNTSSPSITTAAASVHPHTSIRTTIQRLSFYFLLLNLRGWGLYIGANALEDYFILPLLTGNKVVSPLRTNSMSDVEHDLYYKKGNEPPECWYKEVLKAHHKTAMESDGHSDCYGRPFDFSDHVVLFLAHYLPIFVLEMLLYYSFPFWVPTSSFEERNKTTRIMWNVFHGFLFLYLHLLILHALYHTAVYFHTPAEIIVGYIVSLILQLPIMHMMCAEEGSRRLKRFIGMTRDKESSTEKGD